MAQNLITCYFGGWIWQRQWRHWIHVTCCTKKKLGEHDYAKKKSHLLLSQKRMNRYLLDVRLRKQKKIVGGVYSVFRAYEAQNLDILRYSSRIKREKLTSVCGYFHSPLFFNSFIWIEIEKENDTHQTTWINDARSLGRYDQFQSHAIGRRISAF